MNRHHLFTHKRQSDKIMLLKQQHKKDRTLATPPSPSPPPPPRLSIRPQSSQKIPLASASVSMYKRDESLTENLRQQLLHRFKLFAIKLKHEPVNVDSGDFYEQCFNFLGNLIMSNIQGVRKEMFSSKRSTTMTSNATNRTTFPNRPNIILPPSIEIKPTIKRSAVPTVTIKREDGNTFIKKFTCNVCHASLPSLKHLERHSVQHTGEKPHICEVSLVTLFVEIPNN